MNTRFFTVLLLTSLFMVSAVHTYQLSNKDEIVLASLMRRRDPNVYNVRSSNPYINILNGILRSDKFVNYATEIPCNIIQTLETDADEAENFVKQIQNRKVPDIIKDLPLEIRDAFSDIVNIALTLPTEIQGAAEAAVTDAVKVFNDIESGAIIKDLEKLPGVVVSDITAGWGEFTSGLEDDWNAATHAIACLFGDCPTATPASGSCNPATAAVSRTGTLTTPTQKSITSVVTPRNSSVYSIVATRSAPTSSSTGLPPANINAASSPFESNGIKLCAIAFLAVFGIAVLL